MNVSEVGDCDPNGASVWFKVVTDDNSTSLVIDINSPFHHLYLYLKAIVATHLSLFPVTPCISNKTFKVSSNANASYWIKRSSQWLNLGALICVYHHFIIHLIVILLDIIQISRPSYPNENPEGPFYPGEEVEFCLWNTFYVSAPPPNGNNCQWIQGIIPSLSDAWDYEGSNLCTRTGWFMVLVGWR